MNLFGGIVDERNSAKLPYRAPTTSHYYWYRCGFAPPGRKPPKAAFTKH